MLLATKKEVCRLRVLASPSEFKEENPTTLLVLKQNCHVLYRAKRNSLQVLPLTMTGPGRAVKEQPKNRLATT